MTTFMTNGRQTAPSQTKFIKNTQNKAIDPLPIENRNWLIYLLYSRRNFVQCRLFTKKELERSYGQNHYAHYINALIFQEENKIHESLEEFQICYKLKPSDIASIKGVAQCLYRLKRYRLALEAYLEADTVANKSDWDIFFNLGKCFLKMRDSSKALEYVQRAAQLSRQHPDPFLLLNKMLIANKDFMSAVTVCTTALEFCPENVELLTELGLAHINMGQFQQGFERLGSALALSPNNFKSVLAMGCIIQNHGDFDVALSKYRIAVNKNMDSSALWNNIGLCFYGKQKYVAAISCLLRALWLAPLNWRILFNLGLVHLSTNQPASAFHFLCASVNLQSDYAQSFMLLGIALRNLGDLENSHKAFEQAVQISPHELSVLVNYIVSLRGRNDLILTNENLFKFKQLVQELDDIDDEILALAERVEDSLPSQYLNRLRNLNSNAEDYEPDYEEINQDNKQRILDPDEV